jgi:uncharacterized protein
VAGARDVRHSGGDRQVAVDRCFVHTESIGHLGHGLALIDQAQGEDDLLFGEVTKPRYLGFGMGLRPEHYSAILGQRPPIDWFEIISEHYLVAGGQPLEMLNYICARCPVVMHGLSLSIASTAELNFEYLADLKALAARVKPEWISDHLCWTGVHGVNLHDLLPIPYTAEALDHIVSRVHAVQDFLGRPLALENVST